MDKPKKTKKEPKIRKKISSLVPGDIVVAHIPFEENSRDYCNGHDPKAIRRRPYTNRWGESAKSRLIMYIGKDGDDLLYLRITSKEHNRADGAVQYQMRDNSMMRRSRQYPNSYVEVSSLRALSFENDSRLTYVGRMTETDTSNILHRLTHIAMQYSRHIDFRGLIPDDMFDEWEEDLLNEGFTKIEPTSPHRAQEYVSGNRTISRTKEGSVLFHRDYSKRETRYHVAVREGRQQPHQQQRKSFESQVNDLKNIASEERLL